VLLDELGQVWEEEMVLAAEESFQPGVTRKLALIVFLLQML
jgi:hypothetical protein